MLNMIKLSYLTESVILGSASELYSPVDCSDLIRMD